MNIRNLLLFLVLSAADAGAAERAVDIFKSTGISRGLFVLLDGGADLAVELANAEPVLVLVAAPEEKVPAIREDLIRAGVHGRVTVGAATGGRLPLVENLAAVVVADLDTEPGIDRTELNRVLRPAGKLYLRQDGRWFTSEKPRLAGTDDWPQYHHDAAMTDVSGDLLAGPAQGIQWLGGDNSIEPAKMGIRIVGSLLVQVEERGLTARDAYSGLPVWRREDLKPSNRYAMLADGGRVYLIPEGNGTGGSLPSHMEALDLKTGETVLTFSEGIALGWAAAGITVEENRELEKTDRAKSQANRERAQKSIENTQARLADGVLLQIRGGEMVAVDAAGGKRLWAHELRGTSTVTDARTQEAQKSAHAWHHPIIVDGTVYAVEGEPAPSWSYTHWPMGAIRAIHSFDLKTGTKRWEWKWPGELGEPGAAYNMTPVGDWLGLMLRNKAHAKGSPGMIFVKRDGSTHKYSAESPYGKDIGGGHSHARLLFVNDQVWVNGTTKPAGTVDLSQPDDKALWDLKYDKLPRPVGCTVSRATPNYVFGSLTTYSLSGDAIQHTSAARSVCDVGAIPAAGMTFITPTQCFCAPYLPGFKAFHPRKFEGAEEISRLETGKAGAGAKGGGESGWPMYMANSRRGNWTDAQIPSALERAWVIRPVEEDGQHPIVAEWRDNWYTHGGVTSVSVAEGIAVFALVDEQQIVAIDPAGGKELWRAAVDGRIDTAPTIRDGLVYAGTRTGWAYALNRDTGALAWRFFAAPRRDRMLAFGQLESRWPLHGSLLVEDDGVWAFAGRHNDTDGGIWWWQLDAASGEPIASGRLGSDDLSSEVGVSRRSDGRQSGANTPAVTDGKLIFLAGIHLEKNGGKLADRPMGRGEGSEGEHAWWADSFEFDILFPGNQGLVFDYTQMGGYKMPYYGFTQAPIYAYSGKDFVHAGGTTTEQHRGGDRGGRRTEVMRFRKLGALKEVPHPTQNGRMMKLGADQIWSAPYHESDGTGLGGLAVAGGSVLVSFAVENRDHWRDREEMPYRLRVFDFATGERRQDDLELPAKPILHGVSAGAGRVYVACEDGSILCFGAKSQP